MDSRNFSSLISLGLKKISLQPSLMHTVMHRDIVGLPLNMVYRKYSEISRVEIGIDITVDSFQKVAKIIFSLIFPQFLK